MKTRTWLSIAVVAALGLAAGLGIGALAWMGGDHDSDNTAATMGATTGGAAAGSQTMGHISHSAGASAAMDERAFLQQMVPHHEAAIAMAQVALEKAKHPEIRRLARGIASSQRAEIRQMKAWYRQWFGSALQPDTGTALMGADVGALGAASGDDFDRAFLAMMIPHHASAVVMADSVRLGGPRQQLLQLADGIISAQAKEIGQMQQWRERWYPPSG